MWKLVIEDDEGKRTVVPLTRDDYTIGRKEGNTIRLTERNVSREHAKLHKKNGAADPAMGGNGALSADPSGVARYVLEDCSSYNGVYINGLRVAQQQELAHGDLVQIGDYRIILQDDAVVETDQAVSLDSEDLKATMPQLTGLPLKTQTLLEQPNRLIMLAGPTPGTEYPLIGDRLTIGRAEDAGISINHNSVSRIHCEVHALGEGRFEIVDKGSSNGVRVNGADLKRGIIEAGDIIELGDVKFKFVGAGQIFRPGASDSQQLAAIGQRTASLIIGERRRPSIVPYIVLGALVGIAGLGGYMYLRPKPEPLGANTSQTGSAPLSADATTVQQAKVVCDQGDCDKAHTMIAQVPDDSPLRQSQEFKDVEYKWATMTMLRADTEPDLDTKRRLLESVINAPTVIPQLRKVASDKLSQLDVTGPVILAPKDAGRASQPIATAPQQPQHPQHTAPDTPPTVPPVHNTPPGPKPVTPPPQQSAFTLALSSNPADVQKARDMLEPKVFGGRGSPAEVKLLKAICKQQGDRTCVDACNNLAP